MNEIGEPSTRQISHLISERSTPANKENAMAKSEEGESAEAAGNARAKDLGGKARRASKPNASALLATEATQDALAKASESEVVEASEQRRTGVVEGDGAETEALQLTGDADSFQ